MVLLYKLPRQAPCAIPLNMACAVEAVKTYIKTQNQITRPFKLRVFVKGKELFLKASQTLEEVAAMGAEVIGVNYYDHAATQPRRVPGANLPKRRPSLCARMCDRMVTRPESKCARAWTRSRSASVMS